MAAGGWIAFSASRTRPGAPLGVVDKHLEERMLRLPCLSLAAALLTGGVSLHAQETVVGVSDPEALFHSSDPKLDANKQAAYHIVRDLLEAGHWELADKSRSSATRGGIRCASRLSCSSWHSLSPRSSAAATKPATPHNHDPRGSPRTLQATPHPATKSWTSAPSGVT